MGYYPIFVELNGKRCLVVGGGNVGLQKVGGLLAAGAALTLISPDLHP
jgi:siroheme synthase (precorrin-2 oxidase/ferrochelatase)